MNEMDNESNDILNHTMLINFVNHIYRSIDNLRIQLNQFENDASNLKLINNKNINYTSDKQKQFETNDKINQDETIDRIIKYKPLKSLTFEYIHQNYQLMRKKFNNENDENENQIKTNQNKNQNGKKRYKKFNTNDIVDNCEQYEFEFNNLEVESMNSIQMNDYNYKNNQNYRNSYEMKNTEMKNTEMKNNEITLNEITQNEITQNEITQNEITQNEITQSEINLNNELNNNINFNNELINKQNLDPNFFNNLHQDKINLIFTKSHQGSLFSNDQKIKPKNSIRKIKTSQFISNKTSLKDRSILFENDDSKIYLSDHENDQNLSQLPKKRQRRKTTPTINKNNINETLNETVEYKRNRRTSILDVRSQSNLNENYDAEREAQIRNIKEMYKKTMDDESMTLSRKSCRYARDVIIKEFEKNNWHVDSQQNMVIFKSKLERLYIDKKKKQIIPDNHWFTYSWNIMISIVLGIYIFIQPQENFSEVWLDKNVYNIQFNLQLEWVFVIDIFINFITAVRDKQGKMIKSGANIAHNQLTTWFFVDLISSIPSNNLAFFNIISTGFANSQLKILKAPKYIRIFKGVMSIFGSRLHINWDIIIPMSNSEMAKNLNTIKQFLYFIVISNILVCIFVANAHTCDPADFCNYWFFHLMQAEFGLAISETKHAQYDFAHKLLESTSSLFEAEVLFHNENLTGQNRVRQLQVNAMYFVMQTVTTVGQGDVPTPSTEERVFRSVCMIIGVILFTLLSSSVLESTITESLNIQRYNEHEVMIEKLQQKQEITGDPRRQLSLLGDSVQTEKLDKEIEFSKKLPANMCEQVLRFIWRIQMNKIRILQDESLNFFVSFMRLSQFRRCVFDEILDSESKRISFIQTGQIGCQVANLKDQMQNDQLDTMEIGTEIGQSTFLNLKHQSENFMQTCIINTELIEIRADKFIELMKSSLKGYDQVFQKLIEYIFEIYMMVSLYYSMQKQGNQIEFKWYNKTMILLGFKKKDFDILEQLYVNFTKQDIITPKNNRRKADLMGKWQEQIIDYDIYKQITLRAQEIVKKLILDEYLELKKQAVFKINSVKANM